MAINEQIEEPATRPWNPNHFNGEFWDTLGHHVACYPNQQQGKGRKMVFQATLSKESQPPIVLNVVRVDNSYSSTWMCGNGAFQRKLSSYDKIVWKAKDGRVSEWVRCVPAGPVFFDPPPFLIKEMPSMEEVAIVEKDQSAFEFQTAASEFVPMAEKILRNSPKLTGESKAVKVKDGVLMWSLMEKVENMRKMPKDFGVNSPIFQVKDIENMQLLFLPNGRKVNQEEGSCAINFITGTLPTGTGIKFELTLNGLSTGPKVCLGKRFTTEFPKVPQECTKIDITLKIIDIFREGSIL